MRNAFVPINKLPPELLTHICTPVPGTTSDLAHLCAQVCRYWRNTLLASPLLWNVIHVDDPLHVEVHLARSGEAPLEVYFHGGSSTDQFCQKVVPHMDRVRLLYLSVRVPGCEQLLDSLEVGRARLLRELHLKKRTSQLSLSASMMERISSFAVNITTLSLRNINSNLSSLTFPHLLHFSFTTQGGPEGPRVSDVVDFIRGSPMLEELNVHRVSFSYVDGADTRIEPVALQHLKSAKLGGRPSAPSLESLPSLPYIDIDLLPYLHLPQATGRRIIRLHSVKAAFPPNTNHLLTLVRAWNLISGSGDGFSGGAGISYVNLLIKESPGALTGRLEIVGQDDLCVTISSPENTHTSSQPWPMPNWEATTTDEEPGSGDAGDDETETQLLRLGCYLDPLRWRPSPLAALETLLFSGFGHTSNKGKYLQYLRECFMGLDEIRSLQVEETDLWMIANLLRPFEDESGEMVLLFPKLEFLSFDECTPVEPPLPVFVDVMGERAEFGSVLETILVDDEEIDLFESSDEEET